MALPLGCAVLIAGAWCWLPLAFPSACRKSDHPLQATPRLLFDFGTGLMNLGAVRGAATMSCYCWPTSSCVVASGMWDMGQYSLSVVGIPFTRRRLARRLKYAIGRSISNPLAGPPLSRLFCRFRFVCHCRAMNQTPFASSLPWDVAGSIMEVWCCSLRPRPVVRSRCGVPRRPPMRLGLARSQRKLLAKGV